jgi:predicted dehydrogenase
MSKEKIRVGVIGVGYLGRFHALKYAAMDDVQLIGVADTNSEQAQAVAEECATKAFTDYLPLLDEVEAVSIVVPTIYHHAVAIACLEHGVDILL